MIGFSFTLLILLLLLFLPLFAVILRGAISLANQILPKNSVEPSVEDHSTNVVDEQEVQRDLSNPFSPPVADNALYKSPAVGAVPQQAFVRAYLIVLLQVISAVVVMSSFAVFGFGAASWAETLVGVPFVFVVACFLFSVIAPTSFPRSMLVTAIGFVILIVFTAVVVGVISILV